MSSLPNAHRLNSKTKSIVLSQVTNVVTSNGNLGIGGAMQNATATNSIAIGHNAGASVNTNEAILIGRNVAMSNVGNDAIAIGGTDDVISQIDKSCAELGLGQNSIAIGSSCHGNAATPEVRAPFATCIGPGACYNGSGQACVCIGPFAGGNVVPGASSICIGDNSGGNWDSSGVGQHAISIGTASGQNAQERSISIGVSAAGTAGQTVAIGETAIASGHASVAIGRNAQSTGVDSVALGFGASSGDYSLALGGQSGGTTANSITLNASGGTTASIAGEFVVNPIAQVPAAQYAAVSTVNLPTSASAFTHILVFDPVTHRIQAVQHS